jgi:hypothetical protein
MGYVYLYVLVANDMPKRAEGEMGNNDAKKSNKI